MKKTLLLLPLLLLTGCVKQGDKTPLGWCVWEIRKHEGWEDAVYTYNELNPYDEIQQEKSSPETKIGVFIITTYSYPLRAEWCCFIEYKDTMLKYINERDVLYIDCDIIWEVNYESNNDKH